MAPVTWGGGTSTGRVTMGAGGGVGYGAPVVPSLGCGAGGVRRGANRKYIFSLPPVGSLPPAHGGRNPGRENGVRNKEGVLRTAPLQYITGQYITTEWEQGAHPHGGDRVAGKGLGGGVQGGYTAPVTRLSASPRFAQLKIGWRAMYMAAVCCGRWGHAA